MKITIVTPVLNGGKFIRETVDSVLSQAGDFELDYIVRDGGSTDDTLKILQNYESDSRLRVISEPDNSPQAAISAGMAMADGDIGAWLNADDIYEAGALQAVAAAFGKNPEKSWLYGRCRITDETGQEIRRPVTVYKNLLGLSRSRNILLCENYINQPATFWRMDLWQKSGGLSANWKAAWDYELWLKFSALASPLHLRQYLASFRRHGNSISERLFQTQFREELTIAGEHGSTIHRLLHRLNAWKIVTAYKLMS